MLRKSYSGVLICDIHNRPAMDAYYCCRKGYLEYLADIDADAQFERQMAEEDSELVEALEAAGFDI